MEVRVGARSVSYVAATGPNGRGIAGRRTVTSLIAALAATASAFALSDHDFLAVSTLSVPAVHQVHLIPARAAPVARAARR